MDESNDNVGRRPYTTNAASIFDKTQKFTPSHSVQSSLNFKPASSSPNSYFGFGSYYAMNEK